MNLILKTLPFVLLLFLSSSFTYAAEKKIVALAYHDVVERKDQLTSDGVTLDTVINHFEWLLASVYQPASVSLTS